MRPGDRSFTGQEAVTLDEVIRFLNEVLAVDPACVSRVFLGRIRCLPAMAGHPTVQTTPGPEYHTSGLGILNGLWGVNRAGSGAIIANNVNGSITSFSRAVSPPAPATEREERPAPVARQAEPAELPRRDRRDPRP